jgi:alpha-L-fucosidase
MLTIYDCAEQRMANTSVSATFAMPHIVATFVLLLLAVAPVDQIAAGQPPSISFTIADGPFQPTWTSLTQYDCPTWFRDAKLGIWAHYGPQCEPEQGDWYARNMYLQHEKRYFNYHRQTYGHQSQFGFKDICHEWKSEKFDAERLMDLYQRAGAKYFVAMANHHCNFDLWNSKHQPWNSVNVGPQRDFVADWAKAARARGLRFGVSVHNARSWDWYEPAHGSDADGPLKGVPYDGALTKADGSGKWWDGLDPADLYGPHGEARTKEARQQYIDRWFARTKDLVDQHRPDLLYFDDVNLPLGEAGMHIGAHFYNANKQWHDGRLEAVLNTKRAPAGMRRAIVLDLERGTRNALDPLPWQTDTCIGNWHYKRNIDWYQNPTQIIQSLVDIVSKNGNLLLSIPIRSDGTLDQRELQFLDAMAAWMDINGEAIFATRPWEVYGEGPMTDAGGRIVDEAETRSPPPRVRFTTKGDVLYATAFDWPTEGRLLIRSLAAAEGRGNIVDVKLLGHNGALEWKRTAAGLEISLPKQTLHAHAYVFRIAGEKLKPAMLRQRPLVTPASDGTIELTANLATTHGYSPVWHRRGDGDVVGSIGSWGDWEDTISWDFDVPREGRYDVEIEYGCQSNCRGSKFRVVIDDADEALAGVVRGTGTWHNFETDKLGTIALKSGQQSLRLVPVRHEWTVIELRAIRLRPAADK